MGYYGVSAYKKEKNITEEKNKIQETHEEELLEEELLEKELELEEEVELVEWFSEAEIVQLMEQDKFFKNHYEEFENLIKWLNKN